MVTSRKNPTIFFFYSESRGKLVSILEQLYAYVFCPRPQLGLGNSCVQAQQLWAELALTEDIQAALRWCWMS